MKKRSDGRIQRPFTIEGRRYYVYGHTKQELDEKEHAKRKEIEMGLKQRKEPTLNEYHKEWEAARIGSVKAATIRKQVFQYADCSEIWIENAGRKLGEIRLKDITTDDIRQVQRVLKESRKTNTVNSIVAHLSHIFHTAVLERRIPFNPCDSVKSLKRTEPKARDTVHRFLTEEEIEAFFAEAERKNSYYTNVYRLALASGMRAGEIGALYRSDIHDGFIHITKTVTKTETGGYEISTVEEGPKTEHSRRKIPVNEEIKKILADQEELNRLINGNMIELDGTIFKAPEGGILVVSPINREIGRICRKTGITPFTMHAFRATFTSRAIDADIPPKILQELLGHSNFNLTYSLYGHAKTESMTEAMGKLEQFRKKEEDNEEEAVL